MNITRVDSRPLASPSSDGISRRRVVLGAVAAAVVPLAGCGGAALFAPFFTFQFGGVVEGKLIGVSFFPTPASVGQGRGVFGTSNISVNGATSNFDGSFDGREMQLIVANPAPPLAATYSGHFIEDDTIVLTPGDPTRKPITVRLDFVDPAEKRFLPSLDGNWVGTDANGAAWTLSLATDPIGDAGNATVLLMGKEKPGLALEAPLSGYASVHYIELDIARAGGSVKVKGTLQADPSKRVVGTPQVTAIISFEGGGTLRRAP